MLLVLAPAPFFFDWIGQPFYLDLLSRALIIGIAAISLNLILGYGGMISLGHAAYIGIGAYCVGIPSYYDYYDGWLHLALALSVSAAFALVTGAISLRTKGVYFIMITMAFSQMAFFTFLSLEEYGADDGLVIYSRSEFPEWLSMESSSNLYYWIFTILLLSLFFTQRLVHSRFGRVIVGSRFNEERMQALGFNTYRYRLACYVISAMICGLAGMLLGNFTGFINPDMMGSVGGNHRFRFAGGIPVGDHDILAPDFRLHAGGAGAVRQGRYTRLAELAGSQGGRPWLKSCSRSAI
jgi:branched-chain amino acid transport system permease protein